MSQSREKKRRYNQKLEFNLRFESWLREDPLLALEKVEVATAGPHR